MMIIEKLPFQPFSNFVATHGLLLGKRLLSCTIEEVNNYFSERVSSLYNTRKKKKKKNVF